MTMKKVSIFAFVLVAFLVMSTSAMPGVARDAPQCPANDVGNVVFFPDSTNCKYVIVLQSTVNCVFASSIGVLHSFIIFCVRYL